ncbi:MAG: orotidine-5'-phosphate decarboxylase [Thermomicrobiales bacterium]
MQTAQPSSTIKTRSGFAARLRERSRLANSLACVGLDPDLRLFPTHLANLPRAEAIVRFNAAIVEATSDFVCAYKPNLGFYVAHGLAGIEALLETRRMIPADIPVILDCKVGDMAMTTTAYARGYFDEWDFDAITANPYQGEDSLQPFFDYADKGVLVLCKTSNAGSGDLQDVTFNAGGDDHTLYEHVAHRVTAWSDAYPADIGLVVGATYPEQLASVRQICPTQPILLPGVGAQGGALAASVQAGVDRDGEGLIVSSSRDVIYAGSGAGFAQHARDAVQRLRVDINAVRGT